MGNWSPAEPSSFRFYFFLCVLGTSPGGFPAAQEKSQESAQTQRSVNRQSEENIEFYLRNVAPILKAKCFACHGPEKAINPRIDEKDWLANYSHPNGNLKKSSLWTKHLAPPEDSAEELMPPPKAKNPLTTDQLSILKRWIEQGSPYSDQFDWYQPSDLNSTEPKRNPRVKNQGFQTVGLVALILAAVVILVISRTRSGRQPTD
ncbi:MAG: hypothetical protein VX438_06265 [Planctomycetota bacterium]|nr:hypothetical protein [Planctomycetota bacterium]